MAAKITADFLIRQTAMGKLRRETDEIYKTLERMLVDENNSGHSEIIFELPDVFETNSLEKKDLQLIVYSDIIERLESAGFNVEIVIRPSGDSVLHIRWPSSLSKLERDRRNEIIQRHKRK